MGLADLVHNLRSKTRSPRTSADSFSTANSQQRVSGETASLNVDSADFLLASSTRKLAVASPPTEPLSNSSFSTSEPRHASRHLLRLRRSHDRLSDPRTDSPPSTVPSVTGRRDALPDRPADHSPVSESRFSRRGVRSHRINNLLEHSSRSLNFRFHPAQPDSDSASPNRSSASASAARQALAHTTLSTKMQREAAYTNINSPSQSADSISFRTTQNERSKTNRASNPLRRPRAGRVMSSVDHLFRRDDDSRSFVRSSVPPSAANTLASEIQPRESPQSSAQYHSSNGPALPRSAMHRITTSAKQRINSSLSPQGRVLLAQEKKEEAGKKLVSKAPVQRVPNSARERVNGSSRIRINSSLSTQRRTNAPQTSKEDVQKQSLSQRSSSAGQVLDFETAPIEERSSADAAFPLREREPAMPLGRCQSTPAKRSSSLKRRMRLNLPLLKIPTATNNSSTSVTFKSVRSSSGERKAIKDDSIVYAGLVGQETPRRGTRSNITAQSAANQQPSSASGSTTSPTAFGGANQGKPSVSKPQNGVWKAVSPRIADRTGVKVLNHLTEADQELLHPDYVEPLTSRTASTGKTNGTPIDPNTSNSGIAEDSFILQIEDTYVDGGFVISLNGLEDTPEKLVRKVSNGLDGDVVPTSSRNLIIVRSLDEFTRVRTIRGNGTLGRGITGSVYLATHDPTRKFVAVKRINAFDEKKREELKKELTTLISHESRFLVRSHGAFYDGMNGVHIVLEYMDRGSLDDVVSQYGKIPEPVLRKITEHCLLGLRFLHENHVLHRDVKTANILLSSKVGRAKLGDFGLARDLNERKANCNSIGEGSTSETETFVGTFAYMSPERLRGRKYTYASDIWGLGMVVIECALGRPPFDSLHQFFEIVEAVEGTPPVSLIEGCVSPELADFIRLSTDHNPKGRPPASELLRHPWIRAGDGDQHVLKQWLNELPAMHHDIMNDRSGGSVRAQARQLERMRETNQLR